jgi:FkbM family methyltransferase
MIDPKALTTYAQYNEDLILLTLLHDVKKGFYVDVGANYPTTDSVTKLFYDKGWRGINIEPIKGLHRMLEQERPDDVNLQVGAGAEEGEATLREYTDVSGHSTFNATQKQQLGSSAKHKDYTVGIRPLKAILKENKAPRIHFLKIDVEGFEYEVIQGNDWKKYRPEVVCIEANHMSKDWRPMLKTAKYKFFIADGLNEYYVAEESWKRTENFGERIVEADYHALKQHQQQSWSEDSRNLAQLNKMASEQQKLIRSLERTIEQLQPMARLSLKDRTYFDRLKRAAYGLSVDWVSYRKKSK